MTEHVKVTIADGVMEILWNRPDKKNAISRAMYQAAAEALDIATADPAVRVVLLGSTSDAFFTSGNDLSDFAAVNSGEAEQDGREGTKGLHFISVIAAFEKPIVAAVPGFAVGVGGTMLLHCDLVYIGKEAKITMPFVNLALVPEAASSLLLPLRVGHAKAFSIFALGEAIAGDEAVEIGIANKSLPASEVISAAREAARALSLRPTGAVIATKRLMREGLHIKSRIAEEGVIFGQRLKTAEAKEAFTAFREKRAPDFTKL